MRDSWSLLSHILRISKAQGYVTPRAHLASLTRENRACVFSSIYVEVAVRHSPTDCPNRDRDWRLIVVQAVGERVKSECKLHQVASEADMKPSRGVAI